MVEIMADRRNQSYEDAAAIAGHDMPQTTTIAVSCMVGGVGDVDMNAFCDIVGKTCFVSDVQINQTRNGQQLIADLNLVICNSDDVAAINKTPSQNILISINDNRKPEAERELLGVCEICKTAVFSDDYTYSMEYQGKQVWMHVICQLADKLERTEDDLKAMKKQCEALQNQVKWLKDNGSQYNQFAVYGKSPYRGPSPIKSAVENLRKQQQIVDEVTAQVLRESMAKVSLLGST